jgi:hypothetical protein
MEKIFPFSCPVCARVTDYPLSQMVEGTGLVCSFCRCSIRLHGHMLEYVEKEIARMKEAAPASDDK